MCKGAQRPNGHSAGQKVIKAVKTLESLADLSKRVAERFDKKDISKQEFSWNKRLQKRILGE
mgnify:CR=1 FL=1